MASSEEETFGRDIAHDNDFVRTATGDLDTIAGLDNYKQAVLRRIVTMPGSIIHRPNYGVGLKRYAGCLNTIAKQQELAAEIKQQIEQDPRTDKFLGLRVEAPDRTPGLIKIWVRVQPVGYTETTVEVVESI